MDYCFKCPSRSVAVPSTEKSLNGTASVDLEESKVMTNGNAMPADTSLVTTGADFSIKRWTV